MKQFVLLLSVLNAVAAFPADMKEGVGYGAGDSTQEAIDAAKRDAVLNASGMSVDVKAEVNGDEVVSDKSWMRGSGVLWKYTTIEKGESIEGTYTRVKAQIEQCPLTRPLKEAYSTSFSIDAAARAKIIESAIKGFNPNPIEVTVVGLGKDKKAALKMAWLNAVEAAVGRFYEVSSKLDKDSLAREQVMEVSNGYVESFEILEEQVRESGTVRLVIKAVVREGADCQLAEDAPECQRVSLAAREADVKKLFMIELDNMKSVVPYLYDAKIVDTDSGVKCRVGINQDVYNNVFIPRLIQVLMRVVSQKPVEIKPFGKYNLSEDDVDVGFPLSSNGINPFGITIVDSAADGELRHAFNFTLTPELRRMFKEWKREMFGEGRLKLRIGASGEGASEVVEVKTKKLHNTPVPYFAKGWGFWYDDLWLPVLSDDRAYLDVSPRVSVAPGTKVDVIDERPVLDKEKILAAALATDDPTTMELVISILVRVLLGLFIFFDLVVLKKSFGKHVLLGLLILVPCGAIGLGLLALIIL